MSSPNTFQQFMFFFSASALLLCRHYVSSFCILTLSSFARLDEHLNMCVTSKQKAHEDRVHNKRRDPLQQRGRKIAVEKQPSEPPKID